MWAFWDLVQPWAVWLGCELWWAAESVARLGAVWLVVKFAWKSRNDDGTMTTGGM